MQDSLRAMKTALRVLSAMTEKQYPTEADVQELEQYAGPRPPGQGIDEYACDVIRWALKEHPSAENRTFSFSKR